MVKLFGRIIAYNWKYYALAVAVFVIFWQMFSVLSAARVADDKLITAMRQNAAYFEKAFLEGDVFETQRIMWRVKNDNIKRITFHPVEFEGSKWIFKEAIIGNLYDRPWAQKIRRTPFISNGAELGNLEYVIDLVDINASVLEQNYVLFITVVVFFMGLLIFSNLGAIRTLWAVERAVADINSLVDSGRGDIIEDAVRERIKNLPPGVIGTPFAQMTESMADTLQRAARLESELAVSQAVSGMAAQVAHDIRSPLAALDAALKNTAELPEERRVMVRHAVNRIRDIANNLLEKNRQQGKAAPAVGSSAAASGEPPEVRLLSSIIDPVITEKRLQFESKAGINIDFELTRESYGLFARVQPVEFRRMVSNLVNNAVEAMGSHKTQVTGHKQEVAKGEVTISLSSLDDKVLLAVKDSGQGIPPEILAKLGQRGETHGKAGGSGLGLFHARTKAESWGGTLVITSELGKGTTVTIKLPKAEAPAGFVPMLELTSGKPVVVLDDDSTIHQVWQGRFDSARIKEHDIEVIHFSEPDKLREWVKTNPAKAENACYLFDYELLGHKETGLSLAEELGLCVKTILVTSRSEETRIIEECGRLKIRMIPKGLADFVPIRIGDREECIGESKKSAVLIDDDALTHMTWEMAAEANGIKLQAFKDPAEFLSNLEKFPKNIPIYIDSELGKNIKGEDIAIDLRKKGFTNIRLATGHPPEKFSHLPWLEVIGKEPPWL